MGSFCSLMLPGMLSNSNSASTHINDPSAGRVVPFLVLFGSDNHPWNIESWKEVSDTVRGGSSHAKINYLNSSNQAAGISFEGTLDTKTLGGAGFASQVYRHPISIINDRYSGFFLEIEPIQDLCYRQIRRFTFAVKNTPPSTDESSSLIYQFDLQVPLLSRDPRIEAAESKREEFIRISIPFSALVPTYRGRPKHDEKPFDSHHITEISIMCRSFFDQQSGMFQLSILRLGLEC